MQAIRRMTLAVFFLCLTPIGWAQPQLSDQQLKDGWVSLFDGQSLYGWKATSKADWAVVDRTITVSKGDRGFLRTTTQFGDFELELEFKCDQGTNSGVFVHTPPKPKSPAWDCYEINIAPSDNPFPTGGIVGRAKGSPAEHADEWRAMRISVSKGEVVVNVAGTETCRYQDPKPLGRGYISLQLNKGKVSFRNIIIRPLNTRSLFDGASLKGWKEYPEMDSKFSVTDDGELNVKNGRGQLETDGEFADFALRLECQTHAPNLNSGIFFRCIPGDTMMGYECQIQNETKGSDPTQPADCGTGGFFRRQNARKIVAKDQQWFYLTLVADGPHMAAWVNGTQVSDWSDKRKPHANPRKGLRTNAGTIMIQGHDPTTDISFRNLHVVEFPKRTLHSRNQ